MRVYQGYEPSMASMPPAVAGMLFQYFIEASRLMRESGVAVVLDMVSDIVVGGFLYVSLRGSFVFVKSFGVVVIR